MGFCYDCTFWGRVEALDSIGQCTCINVELAVKIDIIERTSEDNKIVWTERYFGCIHHRKGPQSIVDLDLNELLNKHQNEG